MDRRTALGLVAALVLSGCGRGEGAGGDVVPDPAVAVSTPPPSSRGVAATVIPSWVESSGPARRAVEFVVVAATPDVRVDEEPSGAWRRAVSMMTPVLVEELEAGSALGQVRGWGRLQRLDGWVSVEFGNVIGDEPQASPGPGDSPAPSGEGVVVEVVFTRVIHARGQGDVQESSEPLVWMVRVVGDRVVGVSTVTTTDPG